MFLVDKYTPKSIDEAVFNQHILKKFKRFCQNESMPHILIAGPEGSGKQTSIKLILQELFGNDVHNTEDSVYTVIGSGNKATLVTVKQSNYHIVIEPNNNNFDRYLIQDIVKEYAKKMPMPIFKTKKIFKVVLINNVDNLSYYAQTSLRRTMEKYSSTCRFIMWCTSPTRVIEPLISRCVFITINSPTDDELFAHIYKISIQENIKLNIDDYVHILESAHGNIKEALWLLELCKFGYNKQNIYYHTIDLVVSIIISHNIEQINTNDKEEKNKRLYIRDLLYNIMITNINGTHILKDILNKLCDNEDIPDECKYEIINIAAHYEHNLIRGRRNITHLEAPILKIMKLLYDYENINPSYKKIFQKYYIEKDVETKSTQTKKKITRRSKNL